MLMLGLACGARTWQLSTFVVGQCSVHPSEGTFSDGDWITLAVIPAFGWGFDHWGVRLSVSSNPVDILIDSDKTIHVNFIAELTPTPTPTANPTLTPLTWEFWHGLNQNPSAVFHRHYDDTAVALSDLTLPDVVIVVW